MVNNIDPGEAKTMASFIFPDKPTTSSGTAAHHSLLELLASVEENLQKAVHNVCGESDDVNAENGINSIPYFRDLALC